MGGGRHRRDVQREERRAHPPRAQRRSSRKKSVQVFKSHLDDRYGGVFTMSSHDGRTVEAVPVDSSLADLAAPRSRRHGGRGRSTKRSSSTRAIVPLVDDRSPSAACASLSPGRTPISAASRSGRCRSSWRSPTSSTSCTRFASCAAVRRAAISGSSPGSLRATIPLRSWSAATRATKRAAGAAIGATARRGSGAPAVNCSIAYPAGALLSYPHAPHRPHRQHRLRKIDGLADARGAWRNDHRCG